MVCFVCPFKLGQCIAFSNYRYASFFLLQCHENVMSHGTHAIFRMRSSSHKSASTFKKIIFKNHCQDIFIYLFIFNESGFETCRKRGRGADRLNSSFQSGGQGMLWHCTVCDGRGFPFRQH